MYKAFPSQKWAINKSFYFLKMNSQSLVLGKYE